MKQLLRNKNIIVYVTAVIAVIVWIPKIIYNQYWLDELLSLCKFTGSFTNIIEVCKEDVQAPLYYLLLRVFTLIFGNSHLAVNFFSGLIFLGMIIIGVTFVRKNIGIGAAVIYTLFCAFSGAGISFNMEVRPYNLANLFVTLTAVAAYMVIHYGKIHWWFALVAFGIMAAYTHTYALFIIFFLYLFTFIYVFIRNRKSVLLILGFGLLSVLLYLPFLSVLLNQCAHSSSAFAWITDVYPYKDSLSLLYGGHFTILFLLTLIEAVLNVLYLIRSKKEDRNWFSFIFATICVSAVLLTILVGYITSKVWVNNYVPRYISCGAGTLWLGLAIFVEGRIKELPVKIVTVVLGLAVCSNLINYIDLLKIDVEQTRKTNETVQYIDEVYDYADTVLYLPVMYGYEPAIMSYFIGDKNYINMSAVNQDLPAGIVIIYRDYEWAFEEWQKSGYVFAYDCDITFDGYEMSLYSYYIADTY